MRSENGMYCKYDMLIDRKTRRRHSGTLFVHASLAHLALGRLALCRSKASISPPTLVITSPLKHRLSPCIQGGAALFQQLKVRLNNEPATCSLLLDLRALVHHVTSPVSPNRTRDIDLGRWPGSSTITV